MLRTCIQQGRNISSLFRRDGSRTSDFRTCSYSNTNTRPKPNSLDRDRQKNPKKAHAADKYLHLSRPNLTNSTPSSTNDQESADKRVLAPDSDKPKLHKVLAQAGLASRRTIEQFIEEGRVTVNGEPAHKAQRVLLTDRIAVDGKPIKVHQDSAPPRVIAYNKPLGEVVTRDDPQQRPTVFYALPKLREGKWQNVGRLDINSEGLLLFTTSGDLANQLMHPRYGLEREYEVRVLGTLDPQSRTKLLNGVMIDGQRAAFTSITEASGTGANRWYRVVLNEGRNREVRKLFDAVGLTVSRLIRVRYGSVTLPREMEKGAHFDLTAAELKKLRALIGLDD